MAKVTLLLGADSTKGLQDVAKFRRGTVSAFDRIQKKGVRAFKKISSRLGSLTKRMVNFRTIAVGVAGAAGLGFLINKIAEAGDEVQKMSLRLDISAQKLGELEFAANRSGASMQDIEKAIKKMSRAASDADRGLVTYKRAFDELGVTVTDTNGELKSTEVLFDEVTAGLARMENGTKKVALAQELMGRSGTALLPFIKEGSEGIAELSKRARELGNVYSDLEANQSAAFVDAFFDVSQAVRGVVRNIAGDLIPIITTLANRFTSAFIKIRKEGDLDVFVKKVSKSIINSFTAVITFLPNIARAWNDVFFSIKKVMAGFIDVLEAVLLPLELFEKQIQKITGASDEVFIKVGRDLRGLSKELKLSAEESFNAGSQWDLWRDKAIAAIDAVKKEAVNISAPGPKAPKSEGSTGRGAFERAGLLPGEKEVEDNLKKVTKKQKKFLRRQEVMFKETQTVMQKTTEDTAIGMENAFEDLFFNAFEGKMNSLANATNSFLSSIRRSLAQTFGQKIIGSLIGSLGGLSFGGDNFTGNIGFENAGLLPAPPSLSAAPPSLQRGPSASNVTVNIQNNAGNKVDVGATAQQDINGTVIGIVINELTTNPFGPLKQLVAPAT